MKQHIDRLLIFGTAAWVAIVVIINFVVPETWFFDYESLEVTDVCQHEAQAITGVRWALTTMPSSGVDQIFYVNGNTPVDRLEWKGRYFSGETTSTWRHTVHLAPGEYYWRSTTLKVDLLYIFPLYVDSVTSNVFQVEECG